MNDFAERLVADAWCRRLEGHLLGESDCILLADACDHDSGLPGRLLDDEGIDRLLRRLASPDDPAVVERFVEEVLARLDATGADGESFNDSPLPEDRATPSQSPAPREPSRLTKTPSIARRRFGFGRVWPALIAGLAVVVAMGILMVTWRLATHTRPAQVRPRAEQLQPTPSRKDPRATSPGYVPTPDRDVRPTRPSPQPTPTAPSPQSSRPAAKGSNNSTNRPQSVVISEQTINGRFQGMITVDGETREFDTRDAFEAAKRELGR